MNFINHPKHSEVPEGIKVSSASCSANMNIYKIERISIREIQVSRLCFTQYQSKQHILYMSLSMRHAACGTGRPQHTPKHKCVIVIFRMTVRYCSCFRLFHAYTVNDSYVRFFCAHFRDTRGIPVI